MNIMYAYVLFFGTFFIYSDAEICRYSEVSIVLDVSGSIIDSEWKLTKEFTTKLVNFIGISSDGNHIGVATFADKAQVEIYCDDFTSIASMNQAILGLKQYGQFTNIEDGLRKGKEILFSRGCGNRTPEPSSRVIILMTDGEANRGGPGGLNDLWAMADSIRNLGVKIYAVGVGGANIDHLKRITGNTNNVFNVNTFDQLVNGDLISELTSAVCTSPVPLATTTTTETKPPETTTTMYTTTIPTTKTTTTTTTTTTPTTTTTAAPETTTTTPTTTTTTTTPTTTTITPTTTTTTTPETTTTTIATTTTTEKTTTTKKPQNDMCTCTLQQSEYLCLKWTKYEIIQQFKGTCYVDKLKMAIENITKQIEHLDQNIYLFQSCKESLKVAIPVSNYNATDLFRRYDECVVNIDCKLQRWKLQLVGKIELLKKEVKFEEEGFGGLTMPDPWETLFDLMAKKKN